MSGNKRVGIVLQARDRRLLEALAVMRLIDREQTKVVADFTSTRRANNRLLALTRAGLLQRFFAGTIGGGRKGVYALSRNGAALVNAPFRVLHRKSDETLSGDLFLQHQMQINAIFLIVKYHPIPLPQVKVIRWLVSYEQISKAVPITPDAYIELETSSGIRPMFLEVDLGTEALKIWQTKTRAYLQMAISGEFRKIFHQDQFRVLVIVPSERRLKTVRATIAQATDKIFWFTTFESINRDGFWSPIWLRPQGDQKQSLL